MKIDTTQYPEPVTVALTRLAARREAADASVTLTAEDADWAAGLALFLYRWWEADGRLMRDDLAAWVDGDHYGVEDLLADLDRVLTLLGFIRLCD